MNIEFIAQGFLPENSKPSGNVIINALQSGNYNSFLGFTAFVSGGGITNIREQLSDFLSAGNEVQLFVGVDLHGTSKEALDLLIEAGIPTKVVYSPNQIVYHPKIYLFRGSTHHLIIVGSSNLTTSGLFQNIEASLCLSFTNDDPQGMSVERSILDYFANIINGTSDSVQCLNKELIDILVKNNTVLPEVTTRQTSNSVNSTLPQVTYDDSSKLKEKFKKLAVSRPPKGFKKTIRGEVISTPKKGKPDTTVIYTSEKIEGASMWIESGRMTGGSRNILDLSKQGKRDGEVKFGSVEFFGVDKDTYSDEKDITLIYAGKEYVGNTVKYAPNNSNWRIQLKGKTSDKDKFTDVLRANGSQNKIFIFEKTGRVDVYKFYMMDTEDMPMLKDMSSDWVGGGRGGRGRQYGIIND